MWSEELLIRYSDRCTCNNVDDGHGEVDDVVDVDPVYAVDVTVGDTDVKTNVDLNTDVK